MGLPKIGTAKAEKLGVSAVSEAVFRPRAEGGLGFVYRDQPDVDVGIDGHIEIRNQVTDEATGKLVGVQIKAGQSFFRNRTADGWAVYIGKSTFRYWREYAVPVILTVVDTEKRLVYWVLVSDGDFEETEDNYKVEVPEVQRLDSSAADTIEQLAMQAPAQLREKLRALTMELSDATASELERHRIAWREGRRADTRAWLASIVRAPAQLAAIDTVVAAAVLRYAAATTLDEGGDAELARAWVEEARRHDPSGNDLRLRAALRARSGDASGAVALLASAADPSAQIMQASILSHMGQVDAATQVLDGVTPTTDADVADAWRIRAGLCLAANNLAGALNAVARAEEVAPRHAQVRLLRAVITHLNGLIPEARPEDLTWPHPIPVEFLRRDAEAVRSFNSAADAFRELLYLDWSPAETRHIEAWRLAALCALPGRREEAAAFAQEVFTRDAAQPYVLLWAATEQLLDDAHPFVESLAAEVDRTQDVGVALVYAAARAALGDNTTLGEWLDVWRGRFSAAGAGEQWSLWRARVHIATGNAAQARDLMSDLPPTTARILDAELLAAEARSTGDTSALAARLEGLARESGDPQFLLRACQEHAGAGRWAAVLPHVAELLGRVPTPPVRRLAIYTLYNTRDLSGCISLLDKAIAQPEEGTDMLELRRLRADVRLRTGNLVGAIGDLQFVSAQAGKPPLTRDLLNLARAQFFAGHAHELASNARQLRRHTDLTPADSLMVCEMLVHDDPALAREFWHLANAAGVADQEVPAALTLGFQLGLDPQLRVLHARMMALAEIGAARVQQVTVGELLAMHRDWLTQRERVLELYRRGETATHMVAQFLNEPIVHLYHLLPAANEEQATLRHCFALQLRDGGRGVASATAEVAAPGRLALDLSGLLLAAHVGILTEIEAQFAPVRLPHMAIAALRQQRGQLKPHQPSRLEVNRQLLAAERRGHLRPWEGDLPTLDPDERSAAGNWHRWVGLLERARLEMAFVLDLPLGAESPHGRPTQVAGAARLERLIAVADILRFLRESGALPPDLVVEKTPAAVAGHDDRSEQPHEVPEETEAVSGSTMAGHLALNRGVTVYLTNAGAEALATSGLLPSASEAFTLRVDPADQDARRTQLEAMPELEQHVSWMEDLIRRVSDGLVNGRYALLPAHDVSASAAAQRHQAHGSEQATPQSPQADRRVVSAPQPTGGEDGAANSAPADTTTAAPEETEQQSRESAEHDPSAHDEEAAEENSDRDFPLVLRNLAELVSLPPGTVDAVWIDDRFINRHRFAATARTTDLLEVLAALEQAGRITTARRWAIVLQLRSANVRVLPLEASEIVYHLQAAPITDGAVVDTPALRVLRQYAAAILLDANALRVPSPDQLANGEVGELEVFRSYTSGVREALFDIWRSARGQTSAAVLARVEAQSSWLITNLYLDLALLRARTLAANAAPETGVSGFDSASLLVSAIQLLSSGDALQGGPHDALAAAYAQWVYNAIVAPRASRDSAFRAALLDHLRAMFRDWSDRDAENPVHRAVGLVLAGRTFDALPEELRDALADDAAFMTYVGRQMVSSLSVGRWQIPTSEFAAAAATLLTEETHIEAGHEGQTTRGDVTGAADPGGTLTGTHPDGIPIPVLDSDPPFTLVLSRTGPNEFTLTSPDSLEAVRLRDAAFAVLGPSESGRRTACAALRPDVDIGVAEWQRITDELVALDDPAARLEMLTEYRTQTLESRYSEMTARWRAKHRISSEDLRPAPHQAVLRHLRIGGESDGHSDIGDAGGTAVDNQIWENAARALVDEEGIDGAFDRLAGLPVAMPATVRVALDGMTEEARDAFIHRLLRKPTSPFGIVHTIRVLCWFGGVDLRYHRVARRFTRYLLTPEFQTQVLLLRLVAAEANAALTSGQVTASKTRGSDAGRNASVSHAAERLIASWYHAHRFVESACSAGADASGLVTWLEGRTQEATSGLFDQDVGRHDVADPALLRPVRFVAAALQYAGAEASLVNEGVVLLKELRSFFTQDTAEAILPHIDLLRDLDGHPNILGAWLQPTRGADGEITVNAVEVVSPAYAPGTIRAEALTQLERSATDQRAWLALELVLGTAALDGAEAEQFADATAAHDMTELLVELGPMATIAASRIAREALASRDARRRSQLREAFLGVDAPVREKEHQSTQTPPPSRAAAELTELQMAVLHALYLLAQAESSGAAAMAAFAEDVTQLSLTDAAYLRSVRGVLERLVLERPVVEAQACTGLLLEARGL